MAIRRMLEHRTSPSKVTTGISKFDRSSFPGISGSKLVAAAVATLPEESTMSWALRAIINNKSVKKKFQKKMSSRQGGKLKPLKKPKKDQRDLDEDDLEFMKKKKEQEAALKQLKEKASKGGPLLSGGIKKSGKK
ncbi:TMA7-domain-containing protein [Rozella allomycis CSF55]|uniref:TMA7-domain-containing protein n=1 Tax=Rozella allomycis (strain CSF55) TaxID=988480 RepID=A0A075AR16_ROZAC|nr:Translation machinery associated TMA7 domain-containing protein [Rozella allomycis CSF55]RKP22192.1 TMA7-domain-containing protein [Rozella allomycis CSF55]|eukprot:EPZ31012.1 Translation machinery associated TMA7 domain-containing protein [Rozella allomycis CSF55]